MNNNFYQVAGHIFRLSENVLAENALNNYAPFHIAEGGGNCLFHLSIVSILDSGEVYEPVGQFDDDIASVGIFNSSEGNFRFRIAYPGSGNYGTMDVDSAFREAKVKLPDMEKYCFFCLNNCLMLLYAFATANLDTLLLHASVVRSNNEGFVFLGKSGTGKSTHSRLWLEHITGSELLNDDNPMVRIIDGKTYVYGSPWSGKTPCYRNESAPLGGVVKLYQAPENRITKLGAVQAYAAVLPSCSCMRWEDRLMSGVHRTVEALTTTVGCYQLNCLPDREAAELCYGTVHK